MKKIYPPIIFHENILSKDECNSIEKNFFAYLNKAESENHDLINLENAFGVNTRDGKSGLNVDQEIADRLTSKIENAYAKKLKYSHCYIRAYYNNSKLPIHIDHSSLDVTLSVNVGGLDTWPIHISTIKNRKYMNTGWFTDETLINTHKKEFLTFITPLGCGVSCCGKVFPHWRDKLLCSDNEYVLQIFFHWRLI